MSTITHGLSRLATLFFSASLLCATKVEAASYPVLAGDIPPFSYTDQVARGIAVEILQAIQNPDLQFHFEVTNWTRAQALTQQGGRYLIIPLSRTPERLPKYRWIAPLYSYQFVFATKGQPSPTTLDAVKSMKVVTLRSNAVAPQLPGLGLDNVGLSDTEEVNARRLQAGLADAWLAADLVIPYVYGQLGFNPKELNLSKLTVGKSWEVWLAASPDLPEADVQKLAQALESARKQGKLEQIVRRYQVSGGN